MNQIKYKKKKIYSSLDTWRRFRSVCLCEVNLTLKLKRSNPSPLSTSGLCSPSASDTNYYFISEKMSWRKARDYCLTQHTGLAEIHNPDNSTALMNTPNWGYRGDAWIGLRPEPLDWTWVDGEPLTQTLWEQYSSDELCAYMAASGRWRSADCSLKKYGACDTCRHQQSRLPSERSLKFQ